MKVDTLSAVLITLLGSALVAPPAHAQDVAGGLRGRPVSIDPTSTTTGATLDAALFDALPLDRSFRLSEEELDRYKARFAELADRARSRASGGTDSPDLGQWRRRGRRPTRDRPC